MDDKIERILEYISDRSGELYDELQEVGPDDGAHLQLIEQIACFDEIYQVVRRIGSEED